MKNLVKIASGMLLTGVMILGNYQISSPFAIESVGASYAEETSDKADLVSLPNLPYYNTGIRDSNYLKIKSCNLWTNYRITQLNFNIDGVIEMVDPADTTLFIIVNGREYETQLDPSGAFKQNIRFDEGINVVRFEYGGFSRSTVQYVALDNGGMITTEVNLESLSIGPFAIVEFDSYAGQYFKDAGTMVLNKTLVDFETGTLEKSPLGTYKVVKTATGYIAQTTVPTEAMEPTLDDTFYSADVFDKTGKLIKRFTLNVAMVEPMPSRTPGMALFVTPFINAQSVFYDIDYDQQYDAVKDQLNENFFEVSYEALRNQTQMVNFVIADDAYRYLASTLINETSGGSKYKSVLQVNFGAFHQSNPKQKPVTLEGHVTDFDPSKMTVLIWVNGVSQNATLDQKGAFKKVLDLKRGFNRITVAYGKERYSTIESFIMPRLGLLSPELSKDMKSVITQAPLKFTLPSMSKGTKAVKVRVYSAGYGEDNTLDLVLKDLGTYKITKSRNNYVTTENLDLAKLSEEKYGFYGFDVLDEQNNVIGCYSLTFNATKTYFNAKTKKVTIAMVLPAYQKVILHDNQGNISDVTSLVSQQILVLDMAQVERKTLQPYLEVMNENRSKVVYFDIR